MPNAGNPYRITRKRRAQVALEYKKLPLDQRKRLVAIYKSDNDRDLRVDWAEWLSRNLPPDEAA